ncbi:hypothetical protein ASPWEDRAFT_45553 [Aspergillus wentii DTO 134E9]|uniref:Uncharacterized protein n=1 Tax=Aspergillus wentii DTO 134E9 TaxID=1073089 RepID=A0A1L9R9J9_ASPWE|nr:uncharacterized protein ASPWEDRAFT_45553 [Aspergillus wentii DTO 134E9]OJJ31594.1 hypothetical protein ASPWEDRAFT_45553 [Aspergillus wentii DTO 134E9]
MFTQQSQIVADLATKWTGSFLVSSEVFEDVEELLSRKRVKYSFNSFTGILSFTMPTFVHSSYQVWMRQWEENLKNASEEFDETSFMVLDGATLIDFKGRYKTSANFPVAGLYPKGRKWPTIALEAGYSGGHDDDHNDDSALLLEGSEGRIGLAIVAKVKPLDPEEIEVASGFAQAYQYEQEAGKMVKYGGGKCLYPPPQDRHKQCLDFNWSQILRNKKDKLVSYKTPTPPPIYLESLREIMAENVCR